jgi:hypothetical protein
MNIFSFFAKAMGDGENPSAMRVIMVYGVCLILTVWAALCIKSGSLVAFDQSVIEVMALLVVGKVAQSHIETRNPPAP